MKKLKYVINTVPNYKKALDILLESLLEEGIEKEDIIFIYGNSEKSYIEKNNLEQYNIFLKKNLFEFNSILGVSKLILDNREFLNYNYFLIHDTCKVLKGFKEKSLIRNQELNEKSADIYWAFGKGQHNIGIFSPKSLLFLIKTTILPIISSNKFNKSYAIRMEHSLVPESIHLQKELRIIFPENITLYPHHIKSKIYSKSLLRTITYSTTFNLIKYYIHVGHFSNGNSHPNKIL
jgi:hypothetical protein